MYSIDMFFVISSLMRILWFLLTNNDGSFRSPNIQNLRLYKCTCSYMGILFSADTESFLAYFNKIFHGKSQDHYLSIIKHEKSDLWGPYWVNCDLENVRF